MIIGINPILRGFIKAAVTLFICVCITFMPLVTPVVAARTTMTGDFAKDTVAVSQSLQETIAIPNDDSGRSEAQKEAVVLITDYISRYRNRPQVNETVSYTTMQTALNSMAGQIKTFSNRPIPDKLKARLSKELSKAEELVLREE